MLIKNFEFNFKRIAIKSLQISGKVKLFNFEIIAAFCNEKTLSSKLYSFTNLENSYKFLIFIFIINIPLVIKSYTVLGIHINKWINNFDI